MKRALRSRLDKHCAAMSALAAAAALAGTAQNASAAIVYHPAANINIPTTFYGVYVNLVNGVTTNGPGGPAGWDVNPYGTTNLRMYSSSAGFVLGGGTGTNVANLPPGTTIDGTSTFGGNNLCDTTGTFPFVLGSSNNLVGFRFINESAGSQTQYGWMRISLAAGSTFAQPRTVVEWAYEDTGTGIQAGALPPATGACCLSNGGCTPNVSQATCTGSGGIYNGAATCALANCPQPGACCNTDGTCTPNQLPAACLSVAGVYSAGTCAAANCAPAGACCKPDGTCATLTSAGCVTADGFWGGATSTCATTPSCNGACCLPDGTCQAGQTWAACALAAGIFKGTGTTCGTGTCAPELYTDDGRADNSIGYNAALSTTWALKLVSAAGKDRMTHIRVVFGTNSGLNGKTATAQLYPDNGPTPGDPSGATGVLATATATIVGATPNQPNNTPLWVDFDIPDVNIAVGATFFAAVTVPNDAAGEFPAACDSSTFPAGQSWITNSATGTVPTTMPTCADITSVPLNYTWMIRVDTANSTANTCYPNCDASTALPVLNVADFTCFLQKYAANDPYANCDASTAAPTLNVADFTCFLQKYAAGCP